MDFPWFCAHRVGDNQVAVSSICSGVHSVIAGYGAVASRDGGLAAGRGEAPAITAGPSFPVDGSLAMTPPFPRVGPGGPGSPRSAV